MTTKKDDKPEPRAEGPDYSPRKKVQIVTDSGNPDELGRRYAALFTDGAFAALRVIVASEKSGGFNADLDYPGLLETMRQKGQAVNAGSLAEAEAMLMSQATALQTLFARLVENGMGSSQIPAFEVNLRMALRAQSQCRATLETLAAIKNPPVVFARQANVTTGPQQINNGVAEPSRPRENETAPSKLLEETDAERMDTGAAGKAGGTDSDLAPVGAMYRTENRRG